MKDLNELENYKRKYKRVDRTYWIEEPKEGSERKVIDCTVIKSRYFLSRLYLKAEKYNFSIGNLSLSEIRLLGKNDLSIKNKLIFLESSEGIHLAFRPVLKDICLLVKLCPNLKRIFISYSYAKVLGNDAYYYLKLGNKAKIEVFSLCGFRSDKMDDYKIEIYL